MHAIDRRSALKLGAMAMLVPGAIAQLAGCAQGGPSDSTADTTTQKEEDRGAYTLANIRDYVVGIDEPIELEDGTKQPLICFDNAATTPALVPVVEEVNAKLLTYGSIGRGTSQKSDISAAAFDETREKVLSFLGADPETYTCIYTSTATDGLNKLASALIESPDDIVVTTWAEHHSNLLPWRNRCKVLCAEVDENGRIIYDDIEKLLSENKVKYVSITAASNVTGYVTDVHRVAKMAHAHGAKIIVDGAQIVAHRAFSMKGETEDEDIDFFAFSAHKMYAPFGGGAIVGRLDLLQEHTPQFYGGGTVKIVADDWEVLKQAPAKYEAGSPNYLGQIAMGKAIDVLSEVGFDAIVDHEKKLNRKAIDGLLKLPNVIVYGDTEDIDDKVGVVTFNFSDLNTEVLARRLAASFGVATRRGAFCAHPYVWRLMDITDEELQGFVECVDVNTAGMIRLSFGMYNTEEEVDKFLSILPDAIEMAKEDAEYYSRAEPAY